MGQAEVVIGMRQADLLSQSHRGLGEAQDLASQGRDVSPQGQVDSLNVAQTATILMFEARRQRENMATKAMGRK